MARVLILAAGAALLAAGCSSPGAAGSGLSSVGLSGSDDSAFMPQLRISNERKEATMAGRRNAPMYGTRPGPELGGKFFSSELVVRGDYGEYEDGLVAGETLAVDGATLAGPAPVDVEVERTEVRAVGRGGEPIGYGFGFEALAGVGLDALFVDLSAPGFDESVEIYAWGGAFGAGFTYTPHPMLQARAMAEISVGLELEEYSLLQTGSVELALVAAVHPKIRLMAGWRAVEIRTDWGGLQGDSALDLDARLQGLVLGLWLAL